MKSDTLIFALISTYLSKIKFNCVAQSFENNDGFNEIFEDDFENLEFSEEQILSQILSNRLKNNLKQVYESFALANGDQIQGRVLTSQSGDEAGFSSQTPPTLPNFDEINYGCFCQNLTRANFLFDGSTDWRSQTGHPIDSVDKQCKLLKNGWTCLSQAGIDLSLDYTSPGFFAVTLEDRINSCQQLNSNDQGKADLCKVEETFSLEIIRHLFSGNYRLDASSNPLSENNEDRDAICHPSAGLFDKENQSFEHCCNKREYPFKECVYTESGQCDRFGYGYVTEEITQVQEIIETTEAVVETITYDCSCENGIPIDSENCPSENLNFCQSCNSGFELDQNTNSCQIILFNCSCQNGTPINPEICPSENFELCASCDSGYSLSPDTNLCQPNQCICQNGSPIDQPGTCLFAGSNFCKSCDFGYHLQDLGTEDISAFISRDCLPNICVCPDGSPKPTGFCEEHNKYSCLNCNEGYWLEYLTCKCVENSAVSGNIPGARAGSEVLINQACDETGF